MKIDHKVGGNRPSKEKVEFPKKGLFTPKPKRELSHLPLSVNPLFRLAHNSIF